MNPNRKPAIFGVTTEKFTIAEMDGSRIKEKPEGGTNLHQIWGKQVVAGGNLRA